MNELSQRLRQVRACSMISSRRTSSSAASVSCSRSGMRCASRSRPGTEIVTQRQAVEQEVAALDPDLATRQRVFADEIARMEQQTATAKAEQARAEHELQDVRMRLDHTRAVYDEIRKKVRMIDPLTRIGDWWTTGLA